MSRYYVVTMGQAFTLSALVAALTAACTIALSLVHSYYEMPVIKVDAEGKCTAVINFKNGDGFGCADRDVVLRRYKVQQ